MESGIKGQYASLLYESGLALFIDCRSLEAEKVPLIVEDAGLSLLVCDTRLKRGLGETGYNERRKEHERAAKPKLRAPASPAAAAPSPSLPWPEQTRSPGPSAVGLKKRASRG